MLAKLQTYSLVGIKASPVEVEVDVSPSAMPKTVLVGLPEQAVKREHTSCRPRNRQFGIHSFTRSSCNQLGPGGIAETGRVL